MSRHKGRSGTVPSNTLSAYDNNRAIVDNSTSKKINNSKPRPINYDLSRFTIPKSKVTTILDDDDLKEETTSSTLRNGESSTAANRSLLESHNDMPGILGSNTHQQPNEITENFTTEGTVKIVSKAAKDPVFQLTTALSVTLSRGKDMSSPVLLFQFMKKSKPIQGFSFTLNDQTVRFWYGFKGEGFGVIFPNEKQFLLPNVDRIKTRCLSWMGSLSSSESAKFLQLMEAFEREMCFTGVDVSSDRIFKVKKREIDAMLNEYKASPSTGTNQMVLFPDRYKSDKLFNKCPNSSLNSLHRGKRGSGNGTVIQLPDYKPLTSYQNQTPDETVSQESFYGNQSTSEKTTEHPPFISYVSNLRRVTRSISDNKKHGDVHHTSDELMESENPELFEPTLSYTFNDGSKLSVTNQDFKCLYNNDWINDTILDFFLKFYIEESISDNVISRSEVYLFSSFFYTKLVSTEASKYENVKKWVINSDLFSKKYVVVPVNMNYHWFGCIIVNLDKLKVAIEEQLTKKLTSKGGNLKSPSLSKTEDDRNSNIASAPTNVTADNIELPTVFLLVFDSLRQTHSRLMDAVKEFIISYGRDVHNYDIQREKLKVRTCLVPQQPNMSDCGVHVILNTKKFFEKPKETLDLWFAKSSYNHSKLVNEFFEKKERRFARKTLRDVLLLLQKQQIAAHGISLGQEKNESIEENHSDLEIIEDFEAKEMETDTMEETGETNHPPNHNNMQCTPIEANLNSKAKAPTPNVETSMYFLKSTPSIERCTPNNDNKHEDQLIIVPESSQNSVANKDINLGNKSERDFYQSALLSDDDHRNESDSCADMISSQPPDRANFRDRCPTAELDDIEDSTSDNEKSKVYDISCSQQRCNVPVSPGKLLNEKLKTLSTNTAVTSDAKYSNCRKYQTVSSLIRQSRAIVDKTRDSDSRITRSDDENECGGKSTDSIRKQLSNELRESNTVSLGKSSSSDGGKLHQPNSCSPSKSSSLPSEDLVEEIVEVQPILEKVHSNRKDNKRKIVHLFSNKENKSYGKNPKIPKASFFDQFASK